MKDHYSEHLELLETWKKDIELLKEKSSKHDSHKKDKKKPEHVRLSPEAVKDAEGLRIVVRDGEKAGEEYNIEDVDDTSIVVSDPLGKKEKLSKSALTRFDLG